MTLGCLSWAVTLRGQEVVGWVVDERGAPVPDVNIYVPDGVVGTQSQRDGSFALSLPGGGSFVLIFTHVGYETERRTVAPETPPLTVVLRGRVVQGAEVAIRGLRAQADLRLSARSLAVLPPDYVAARPAEALTDLLSEVPGVATVRSGPATSVPVVRGLRGSRVTIWDEGIALAAGLWNPFSGAVLDPAVVSSLQVLKGPAVLEYGLGGLGGAVVVQRRSLFGPAGLRGQAEANGGTNNGLASGSVILQGGGDLSWSLSGSARVAGDARTPTRVVDNSGYRGARGTAEIGYQTNRSRIQALVERETLENGYYRGAFVGTLADLNEAFAQSTLAAPASFSYAMSDPSQTVERLRASTEASVHFGSSWRAESVVGVQRLAVNAYPPYALTDHRAAADGIRENVADARISLHRAGESLAWAAGIAAHGERVTNDGFAYAIPNFRRLTFGLYALPAWILDDLIVETGFRMEWTTDEAIPFVRDERRYEQVKNKTASTTAGFNVNYLLSPTWSASGGLMLSWRAPDIYERFFDGVRYGTAAYEIGNPNLSSESSMHADLTLRHVSSRLRLEATFYHHTVNGFIQLVPDVEPTYGVRAALPTFRVAQTNARLIGAEMDGRTVLLPELETGARLALLRGTDTQADAPLALMPPDEGAVYARWSPAHLPRRAEDGYLEIEVLGVRRQTRVAAGSDYLPAPNGHVRLDAEAGVRCPMGGRLVKLGLVVRNLLNTRYRDYLNTYRYFTDEPGIGAQLRITVPLGPPREP